METEATMIDSTTHTTETQAMETEVAMIDSTEAHAAGTQAMETTAIENLSLGDFDIRAYQI